MNDSTELAQRMKAAALKATEGPWITYDDDWSDGEDVVITNEDRDGFMVSPVAVIKGGGSESCANSPFYAEQRANAEHIATSCPENVVALVEALEKTQTERDEFRNRLKIERAILKDADKRIAELEESHAQVIQSRDHYKRMSEEGLNAIREARTVKLPGGYSVRKGHPFYGCEEGIMIPKDGGPWLSRFDVEHALQVAVVGVEGE